MENKVLEKNLLENEQCFLDNAVSILMIIYFTWSIQEPNITAL